MKKLLFTFFALALVAGAYAQPEAVAIKSEGMAIAVDGVLDEAVWQDAIAYPIETVFTGEEIAGGATDCSGFFQTAWTDEGIYVAVTVYDDVNQTGNNGFGPVWNSDMVEIYFDMNVTYLNDSVGAGSGQGHYQNAGNADNGAAGNKAYMLNDTGYTKEAFLKWADLKDKNGNVLIPNDTLKIGFDVYIIDNDADTADTGKGYRNRMVWSNDGTVNENWGNMNDAGLLSFDMINSAANDYVTTAIMSKGAPLKIDGVLDEPVWGKAASYPIEKIYNGEVVAGGDADLSGYFKVAWDYRGIYVAVDVTDDVNQMGGGDFGPAWNSDMVEIYFDMNAAYLNDSIGPASGTGHYQNAGNAVEGASATVAYKFKNTATDSSSYIKEVFMSWNNLKDKDGNVVVPDENLAIGFDVQLIDNDADINDTTRNYRNRKVWSNNGDHGENYSNMNDAGLMKFAMSPAYANIYKTTFVMVTGDTILVDGKLTESIWDSVPKVNITNPFKGEVIAGGADDLSGYFQAVWNDQGVYVAVTVTDDVNQMGGGDFGPGWNSDKVEIYFDMNKDRQDGGGASGGKGHYQFTSDAKTGTTTSATSILSYSVDSLTFDYIEELFVPWSTLKLVGDTVIFDAKNNATFGFDVQLIDNDADSLDSGRGYRNRLIWSNRGDITENWSNMDDAGVVTLSNITFENVTPEDTSININEVTLSGNGNATVYPNPVNDILFIANVSDKAVVSVFSIEGRMLIQTEVGATSVDLSSLQNGIYLVRVMDQNKETIKRVLVQ